MRRTIYQREEKSQPDSAPLLMCRYQAALSSSPSWLPSSWSSLQSIKQDYLELCKTKV